VGLIVSDATAIPHPVAAWDMLCSHFHGIAALESWKRILAEVKASGGKMMPQLWHSGFQRENGALPNPYLPSLSPSGIYLPPKPDPTSVRAEARLLGEPMTIAEIEAVVTAFGDAADTARSLGFDAIEIHGAHGYLIDQFFWAETNRRTDDFGGDIRRRSRFAAEIVKECRRRVGHDFPIFLRISQWKMTDYAARLAETPGELEQMLAPLVDAGVDVIDTSTRRFWEPEFPGSDMNIAGWAKKITGKPTVTVGSIGIDRELDVTEFERSGITNSSSKANSALTAKTTARLGRLMEMFHRGDFDLVAIARIILANPAWSNHIRSRRYDLIAPFSVECMQEPFQED
jgi:2,4-dienoyl-CoA reductase-like NADH-dependent reductase (Old Yellow Enzyme family)